MQYLLSKMELLTKCVSFLFGKRCWNGEWEEGKESLLIQVFNMNLPLLEPPMHGSV